MNDIDEIQRITTNTIKFIISELAKSSITIDEQKIAKLLSSISASTIFNLSEIIEFPDRIAKKTFFARVMWSTNKNIHKLVESSNVDTGEVSIFFKNIKKENE